MTAWIATLAFYYVGFVGSWGVFAAAMLVWSIASLPLLGLTLWWLARCGVPWQPKERKWILLTWLALFCLQLPLWLAGDHPWWDGREWTIGILEPAQGLFPFLVTGWALRRAWRTRFLGHHPRLAA
jgi:hypothetical protein